VGNYCIWHGRGSAEQPVSERKLNASCPYLMGWRPAWTSRDRRMMRVLRRLGGWLLREYRTFALTIQTDKGRPKRGAL